MMPPSGLPRPDKATYEAVTAWFERELDRAAEANPNPGRLPAFHRLNRAEYHNAVRDLLGLRDRRRLAPAVRRFQLWVRQYRRRASACRRALVESYLEAARKISQDAMGDPSVGRETVRRIESPPT